MAEYINKEDLKFLEIPIAPVLQGEQVHTEQGFLKEWLESVPTADVVERAEYDKVVRSFKAMIENQTENLIAIRNAYYQVEKENTKLRSKIEMCVDILERNIGE